MKKIALAALLVSFSAFPGAARAADGPADVLRNLKGCFEVTYRFIEDGAHDLDLRGGLYEKIDYEEAAGVLKFQHYGIEDGQAHKHFREEWSQSPNGMWKQRVIGPFEDFRYECEAPFAFNQWKCAAPGSPKPLRDSKRKDYAKLDREYIVQITPKGWVQSETNVKRAGDGTAVSNEVGWVEYKRVEDANCAPASQNP